MLISLLPVVWGSFDGDVILHCQCRAGTVKLIRVYMLVVGGGEDTALDIF